VSSDSLHQSAGLTADELVEILAMVAGTDIAELDVTIGTARLKLRRPPLVAAGPSADGDADPGMAHLERGVPLAIASPLVGIFHPAVSAGDSVQPGQSIGAIEALGMPTNVDAPQSGTVEDLLVPDGSPVEYGQPLLTLRRAAHGA
jgi:acetyl-CoA carboxylase biotin carboxyl carrier protein